MGINAQYTTTTPAFRLIDTPSSGFAYPTTDPSALGDRPPAVLLQAETEDIRFTVDGSAPTSSVGMLLVAGDAPFYYGGPLIDLRFIQAASGAKLNVTYVGLADAQGPAGPQGDPGAPGAAGATGPAFLTVSGNVGTPVIMNDITGIAFNGMELTDGGGGIADVANPVPSGGLGGQVLTKTSSTDYDLEWTTPSGGGGQPSTTVTLDATQLSTLDSVPVELVPAQGAGTIVAPSQGIGSLALNGSASMVTSSALQVGIWGTMLPAETYNDDYVSPLTMTLDKTLTSNLSGMPLNLTSGDPIPLPGAITASDLANGGSLWVAGDTFVGPGNAAGVVDTVNDSFPIVAVDNTTTIAVVSATNATNTILVTGDQTALFPDGSGFVIVGGVNDGFTTTVASTAFGGVTTAIVTNDAPADSGADGTIPRHSFTVTGDASGFTIGDSIQVYRSTANDGTISSVVSATYSAPNTVILLNTDATYPVDTTADGYLVDATTGAVGAITTYTITDAGTNVTVGNGQSIATSMTPPNDTGTGATINVTAVDVSGNPTTLTVTTYYNVVSV